MILVQTLAVQVRRAPHQASHIFCADRAAGGGGVREESGGLDGLDQLAGSRLAVAVEHAGVVEEEQRILYP